MADNLPVLSDYWRKFSKRERVITVITLFCVLSLLLYRFPYALMEKSVISLHMNIVSTEKDILDMNAQIADLQRRAAGGSSGWELTDRQNAVTFFEDVSDEARRLGVGLVAVHPTQEIDKEKYKEVSLNLDLKGRYRDLGGYFKRLEGLHRLVNVRKIRLESCPDSASVCAAQIEAVTYMSK
jgi:Tfp pilus assembly protein PilO